MKIAIENRGEARMMISLLRMLEDQDSPLVFEPAFESFYEALRDYYLTPQQRNAMNAAEDLNTNNLALAALIGVDAEYAAFAYG